jgi:hypothetical protein
MTCFFLHRIVIRFTHNIVSRTSYRLAGVAILILLAGKQIDETFFVRRCSCMRHG